MFTIGFLIKVNKLPSATWTNVFHFTADADNGKYGDRIPALYIHKDGHFLVCSAVNGNQNCKNINFVVGKEYQMAIVQYKEGQIYSFEVIKDDQRQYKIANTDARSFPKVEFYASDPWNPSFSSNWGSICNLNIEGMNVFLGPHKGMVHYQIRQIRQKFRKS